MQTVTHSRNRQIGFLTGNLMPKSIIMLLLLILSFGTTMGQLSTANYAFSTNASGSLALDLNSNTIDMTTGTTSLVAAGSDQGVSPLTAIGFNFPFMGNTYTQFSVSANGVMQLGGTLVSGSTYVASGGTSTLPKIGAITADMITASSADGGGVTSKVFGTAPNRVLVVQWICYLYWLNSSPPATWQVRLYETTGQIEFVYGSISVGASTYSSGYTTGFSSGSSANQLASVTTATNANSYSAFATNSYSANAAVANLNSASNGVRRVYLYTPSNAIPATPATITFSAISSTTTTVNWVDNSTNEGVFLVTRATDAGFTQNVVTATVNSTTTATTGTGYNSVQTGLLPGTTYYYKIEALSEINISGALTGSQATNPPGNIVSIGTGGNWSVGATWVGGVVPTATDNVTIADGATVTIDNTSATCFNLTVGQGVSGILQYGASASTLTVNSNLTVSANAQFIAGTGTTAKQLNIGGTSATSLSSGSLTVDGVFDMFTSNTILVSTSFFGSANGTVSGSGSTCDFGAITVNKGTNANSILDVTRVITQTAPASGSRLTITAGTFKLSSASALTPYFGAATICSSIGRLWLNNSGASVQCVGSGTTTGAGAATISGILKIDAGSFAYGSGNNVMTFTSGSGVLDMTGGTLTSYGPVSFPSNAATQFNMSGGDFIVDAQAGNLYSTTDTALFTIGASTTVNWSGGTVTIVDPHSAAGGNAWSASSGGTKTITGGTLRIGDGTSGTASGAFSNTTGFGITSSMPIWNLVIDNRTDLSNTRMARITGSTTVSNAITINANGYLFNGSGTTASTIIFNGDTFTNNGTFAGCEVGGTQTIGTIQYGNGTTGAQTVTGSGNFINLGSLGMNNNGGLTLSQANQYNTLRVNFFDTGSVFNASKLTLGHGGASASTVQFGQASGTAAVGSFDSSPTFNIGTGGLTLLYSQEGAARTTGFEIPGTRTVATMTIDNTNGVILAGGPVNLSAATGLTLTAGNLTTSAANLLTLNGTTTGAISGGSATSYINGPVARTLAANQTGTATFTFPVGKSGYNPFELVNPTTNAGGTVVVRAEAFDGNSGGTPGTLMSSINTNRYWAASITSGSGNFTNTLVKLNDTRGTQDAIAASATQSGAYDQQGGVVATLATGSITTTAPALTTLPGFFLMGNLAGPTLTNLSITPAGNQCTNIARTVTVDVTPGGSPTITSAVINYQVNGGANQQATMTNTSGNTWSGTIPTVTPANGTVTWSVVVTDGNGIQSTLSGTSYKDEPNFGITATATASQTTSCSGSNVNLNVNLSSTTAVINEGFEGATFPPTGWTSINAGSGNSWVSGTSYYCTGVKSLTYNYNSSSPANAWMITPGISMTAGVTYTLNFTYKSSGATFPEKLKVTYGNAATVAAQTNTLLDYPSVTNSACNTGTATITPSVSGTYYIGFNCYSIADQFYLVVDDVVVSAPAAANAYSWSDGTNIVGSTASITVNPTSNTTYTATLTLNGCPITSNAVSITTLPLPAAPAGANSSQCGTAVPTAFVVSQAGVDGSGTFKWYDAASGGNLLQSSASTTFTSAISTTTTFYVSEVGTNSCESPRTAVTVTVNPPDAVAASASPSPVCANSSLALTATVTGNTNGNNYTFTWVANTSTGSGIATPPLAGGTGTFGSPASTNITPTAAGTYTYTVTAVDGSCTTTSAVTVTVIGQPVIDSVKANPTAVCAGAPVTLNVYSAKITSGPASAPSYTAPPTVTYPTEDEDFGNITITQGATTILNNTTAGGSLVGTIGTATGTGGGYSNFTAFGPYVLNAGTTYGISLTSITQGGNYGNSLAAWIDYNRDGDFDDLGEEIYNQGSTITGPHTSTGNFTVPVNATPGYARLRVLVYEGTISSPTTSVSWGEYEEYMVDLKGLTTQNPDLTYTWSTAQTGTTVTVNPTVTPSETYTVTAFNSVTGCTSAPSSVTVTVNPIPADPSTTGSEQCGSAIPTASVSSNSGAPTPTFKWYDAASGGNLLQTSTANTYLTAVSTTTTFYVSEISDQGCESGRVPVTVIVATPDPLTVTSSTGVDACLGESFDLSSSYVSDFNSFATFDLTATGGPISGVTGTVSLTPNASGSDPYTVTPTASGTFTYTITAYDPDKGCTSVSSVTVNVRALPVIATATATPSTVCEGQPVTLAATVNGVAAGTVTLGAGATNSTSAGQSFFPGAWGGTKTQYIIRASELTAAGMAAGPITSMSFEATTSGQTYQGFAVQLALTTQTAMTTTFINSGFTQVYKGTLANDGYTPIVGVNTLAFGTGTGSLPSFNWDGTSNIVVSICWSRVPAATTATASSLKVDAPGFTCSAYDQADSQTPAAMCASTTADATGTSRPRFVFNSQVVINITNNYNWTWNPGAINAGTTGSTVVTPAAGSYNYVATATDAFGCSSNSANVSVTVNVVPVAPSVSGPATKCGPGAVTLSVTGAGGTYKWYNVATGGTSLATGATFNLTVNRDTTIYVSETNGFGCEGPRAAWFIDYSAAPTLAITAGGPTTFCAGGSVTLNGASASDPSYVNFSWSPSTGLSATNTASVTANPTTTTTYTLTADDGAPNGCTNTATVTVTVNPLPTIASAVAVPSSICVGVSSALTAETSVIGATNKTLGAGATTASSYDGIFYHLYGGAKTQFLVRASELSALGIVAGNINSLGINVASGTGTYSTFAVQIGHTTQTTMTSTLITTGLTQVYSAPSYSPTTGTNTFTFSSPFNWNGTDNIVIQFCWSNNNGGGTSNYAKVDAPGFTSCAYYRADNQAPATLCAASAATSTTSNRPQFIFNAQAATTGPGTYNWVWNTVPPTTPQLGSVASVSPTVTTSYVVTATDPVTNCSTTSSPVTVNVIPVAASASVSPATPVCAGTSVTLSAGASGATPLTISWSDGTNNVGSGNSINVSPTVTTTYTVTVTDPCNNSTTSSVTVNVNPLPTVTVSPTTGSVCTPGGTPFTLTANGATTYSWSPAGGLDVTSGATVNALPSATTTYTVTGTDGNGCVNTAQATITANPAVQNLQASALNNIVCNGTSTTLNASSFVAGPVNQYVFATSTGATLDPMTGATNVLSSSNDDTPTGTPANIGFTFTLNGTAYTQYSVSPDGWILLGGATATSQFTNAVTSTTNIPKIYPFWDDLATGSSGNVKTLVTGVAPNRIFKVQWFVTIPRNTTGAANSTFQAWLYEGSNKIEFRYGAMGTPSSGSISAGITASATNYQSITYSSNTASTSSANDVNTTAPASGRMYTFTPAPPTYTWNPGNLTGASVNVTPSSTTTYTLTATTAAGCSATATTTVTVNPRPTASISGSGVYCQGQNTSTNLTVTFTGTAPWNYTISGGASPITGTTSSNPLTVTVSPDANTPAVTTYTVTALSDANCTSIGADLTGSATVTVNPLAANPTATVTHPTCALATGSITMTAPLGAGNSYTLDGTTTITWPTITFTGVAPGNHTITVANSFGCSAPASASVTVNPQPFTPGAPVVSGPTNVCAFVGSGTPVTYTATATGFGNQTFNWQLPPNVTLVSGAGTGTITVTFAAGFSAQANKQIRLTVSNQCGTSPQVIYYLLAQYPSTPATITASSTDVCAVLGTSTPITFTIPKAPGAASYIWSAQPGTTTITSVNGPGANDTSVTVTFASGFTTSAITVQAVNSCGVSGTRSLTLTKANPATPGLISGPTNVCAYIAPGPTATYSVAVQPTVATYIWTLPAGATNITYSGATNNQVSFNYPTGYSGGTISVVGTNGCGTSATPRSLAVATLSPATPSVIDVINTVTCADPGPDRVYSYSLSGMPANATSVQWTIPAAGTITSGQGTASITVSYPPTSVVGTVTATAVNNCGSSTVRSVEVKLASCPPEFASNSNPQTKGATLAPVPVDGMEVKVFPNPTVSDFKLQVQTSSREMIHVRVLDMTGREYRLLQMMPGETLSLGAQLKAGSYILEIRQGKTLKTTKVLKF